MAEKYAVYGNVWRINNSVDGKGVPHLFDGQLLTLIEKRGLFWLMEGGGPPESPDRFNVHPKQCRRRLPPGTRRDRLESASNKAFRHASSGQYAPGSNYWITMFVDKLEAELSRSAQQGDENG